jgi:hypothetical protein
MDNIKNFITLTLIYHPEAKLVATYTDPDILFKSNRDFLNLCNTNKEIQEQFIRILKKESKIKGKNAYEILCAYLFYLDVDMEKYKILMRLGEEFIPLLEFENLNNNPK